MPHLSALLLNVWVVMAPAREKAEVLGGWGTWRKHLRSGLGVQDKEGKVREGVARNGWKVTVIADEDGKIGRTLNAFFTPRAYGVEGLLKQPF